MVLTWAPAVSSLPPPYLVELEEVPLEPLPSWVMSRPQEPPHPAWRAAPGEREAVKHQGEANTQPRSSPAGGRPWAGQLRRPRLPHAPSVPAVPLGTGAPYQGPGLVNALTRLLATCGLVNPAQKLGEEAIYQAS